MVLVAAERNSVDGDLTKNLMVLPPPISALVSQTLGAFLQQDKEHISTAVAEALDHYVVERQRASISFLLG